MGSFFDVFYHKLRGHLDSVRCDTDLFYLYPANVVSFFCVFYHRFRGHLGTVGCHTDLFGHIQRTWLRSLAFSPKGSGVILIQLSLSPWSHFHMMGMSWFMSDINQPSLPTLFLFCSCVYFCLYGLFNCISFHKFSRQLSAFSLCSSCLICTLLVLSTTYLFMKVSFSPDVSLCG